MLLSVLLATAIALPFQGDSVAAVDRVFSFANSSSPGCAVAVARGGTPIVSRAYGMANLEYDVPNTPNTIFEAGSVSKQFTAAAVLLLAQDGKLSLEDPVAKYFPELPDYGKPITIRQMLNHTSGLRDWGTVVAAAGWPRGTRTYTHVHVLDVIARQKALNFEPGAEYLYSNSNYNLAAMLVERLSRMSLAEFTRTRLFQPLGMTSTSWRDDYTRIVKQRATAYARSGADWRQSMPFENIYGNSSLLTTVGDLLTWNENLVRPVVGGASFARAMETRGVLNSGRTIEYALGVRVANYRGIPVVSHNGATAGYRAFLARYPEQRLSVSLLCNASAANPETLGRRVADIFLPASTAQPPEAVSGVEVAPADLEKKVGVYRDVRTGEAMRFTVRDSVIQFGRAGRIRPLSADVFSFGGGRIEFAVDAKSARVVFSDGDTASVLREAEWKPSAAELAQLAGTYTSDEAEARFVMSVKDGKVTAADRYGRAVELTPQYKDAFVSSQGTLMIFRRDAGGRVIAVSLGLGRVRDLRMPKQ